MSSQPQTTGQLPRSGGLQSIKGFIKACFWLLVLAIGGLSVASLFPEVGLLVFGLASLVALIALIRPIDRLGLGNRAVSSCAVVILLACTMMSFGLDTAKTESARVLAELRENDPAAYFEQVRARQGDTAWLTELAALDPEAHRVELNRREAAHAEERAAQKARNAELAALQSTLVPKADAYQMCKRAVQSRVKFPSESDYALSGIRHWACEGKTCVAGNVTLMNGLGNRIPHRYYCELTKSKVLQAGFEPGSW